jgi:hypothetical protein
MAPSKKNHRSTDEFLAGCRSTRRKEVTMTMQMTISKVGAGTTARSVGAVVAGMLVGSVLSLASDQVLRALGVFPRSGAITYEPLPYALAIAYRSVYALLGFYIMARLAPRRPLRHIAAGAVVGLLAGTVGVLAALTSNLGPVWYPVMLVVTTLPCAWLSGALYTRERRRAPRN